jgi:hypothetical protein
MRPGGREVSRWPAATKQNLTGHRTVSLMRGGLRCGANSALGQTRRLARTSAKSGLPQRTNPLARERAAREAEGWARYTAPVEPGVR